MQEVDGKRIRLYLLFVAFDVLNIKLFYFSSVPIQESQRSDPTCAFSPNKTIPLCSCKFLALALLVVRTAESLIYFQGCLTKVYSNTVVEVQLCSSAMHLRKLSHA